MPHVQHITKLSHPMPSSKPGFFLVVYIFKPTRKLPYTTFNKIIGTRTKDTEQEETFCKTSFRLLSNLTYRQALKLHSISSDYFVFPSCFFHSCPKNLSPCSNVGRLFGSRFMHRDTKSFHASGTLSLPCVQTTAFASECPLS